MTYKKAINGKETQALHLKTYVTKDKLKDNNRMSRELGYDNYKHYIESWVGNCAQLELLEEYKPYLRKNKILDWIDTSDEMPDIDTPYIDVMYLDGTEDYNICPTLADMIDVEFWRKSKLRFIEEN